MFNTAHARDAIVDTPEEYWCQPEVAARYDSGRFSDLSGRLYRWREERVVQSALRGLPPGSRVLDAACGTGRITALLRRNGFQVTGCDISLAMMMVARRRLRSVGHDAPLVETRVEHLPFSDRSFDAATCIGLLMHLDADRRVKTLRELARVSRGRLIVQYGCVDAFQRIRTHLTGRPPGGVRNAVSEREMLVDLQRSGLTAGAKCWILRGLSSSLIVVARSVVT